MAAFCINVLLISILVYISMARLLHDSSGCRLHHSSKLANPTHRASFESNDSCCSVHLPFQPRHHAGTGCSDTRNHQDGNRLRKRATLPSERLYHIIEVVLGQWVENHSGHRSERQRAREGSYLGGLAFEQLFPTANAVTVAQELRLAEVSMHTRMMERKTLHQVEREQIIGLKILFEAFRRMEASPAQRYYQSGRASRKRRRCGMRQSANSNGGPSCQRADSESVRS